MSRFTAGILGLILIASLGAIGWRLKTRSSEVADLPPPEREMSLIAGGAERPDIEITADHQLARTIHKDAEGRIPLEQVQTSAGIVTIQRTFSDTGKLLREEAFLDGKTVPVPRR